MNEDPKPFFMCFDEQGNPIQEENHLKAYEEVEEDVFKAIETVENNYEKTKKQKISNPLITPKKGANTSSKKTKLQIMKQYFGTEFYELGLQYFESGNVFQMKQEESLKKKKFRRTTIVSSCYCEELFPYDQEISLELHPDEAPEPFKILKCRCTCKKKRCFHACASLIRYFDRTRKRKHLESHPNAVANMLLKRSKELSSLKREYLGMLKKKMHKIKEKKEIQKKEEKEKEVAKEIAFLKDAMDMVSSNEVSQVNEVSKDVKNEEFSFITPKKDDQMKIETNTIDFGNDVSNFITQPNQRPNQVKGNEDMLIEKELEDDEAFEQLLKCFDPTPPTFNEPTKKRKREEEDLFDFERDFKKQKKM